MNVKRLDGRMLNFWIAKSTGHIHLSDAAGLGHSESLDSSFWHRHNYNPANDWSHAGVIVSENWYAIEDTLLEWFGEQWPHTPTVADNPLKWFMRAFVATQFGDDVEDVGGNVDFDDTNYQTHATQQKNVPTIATARPWYKVLGW
jgi:hypothetical protein